MKFLMNNKSIFIDFDKTDKMLYIPPLKVKMEVRKMVVIKLLTSPTCPYCPRAREVLRKFAQEREDVIVVELSVTTEEGLKEAMKYGISGVPAIIINDRYVLLGVPRIEELERLVEEVKGVIV